MAMRITDLLIERKAVYSKKRRWAAALSCGLALMAQQAFAHGDRRDDSGTAHVAPPHREQKAWGIAGERRAVTRTVRFSMNDRMRFSPQSVTVAEGETVRFIVKNDGKTMHEFVMGTKQELDDHAALMRKHPNMEHDEPYMAHVAPGRTGEIVWTFNRPGEFAFACLIAGHYESGMTGRISVVASAAGEALSSSNTLKEGIR
jgi:uncharacterized cupredoxin-like copper-binding protein